MTKGYRQVIEGEWVRVAKRGHINQCCECCLSHVYDYAVTDGDDKAIPGARLKMRVRIDRRKTAASRRKLRFGADDD